MTRAEQEEEMQLMYGGIGQEIEIRHLTSISGQFTEDNVEYWSGSEMESDSEMNAEELASWEAFYYSDSEVADRNAIELKAIIDNDPDLEMFSYYMDIGVADFVDWEEVYHYNIMKANHQTLHEELIASIFHPINMQKALDKYELDGIEMIVEFGLSF